MSTTAQHLRTFYTLVLTQTLSLLGSRISGLAIGIWVFQQTGDATPLALVAFFSMMPQIVLSSIAGVLADRWDRRYVMAISDFGQGIGTLILLVLFAAGLLQLWQLYLIAFLQALFGVFQQPAFSASITMLVPDEQRDRANTIQQLTGPTAGILAPMIAGFVFASVGVTGAILIDLVTFLIAVAVVLSIKIPHPRKTEEGAALSGSMWLELSGGFRYLWQRPTVFRMVMCLMLMNFLFGGVAVLFTPYLLARTGSETAYGVIMGLFNAGGLVGGILFSIWGGTRPRMNTILPGAILMGIFFALVGVMQTPVTLAVICFLCFLPNPMVNALFMSIMQAKVPPDLQGRVFAVIGQLAMLIMPIGYLIFAPLADNFFEPLVATSAWASFAPFFGTGAGSGMGLMFFTAGVAATLLSVGMFIYTPFRTIESTWADYVPQAQQKNEEALAVDLVAA